MHKMALLQAEVAELRKANALISKRCKAKKHESGLEDHLIHKTYKIFRIKKALRGKYSRKSVKMMLDQVAASHGNAIMAIAGSQGIMRELVK
jgi:hypothetical protein